MTFKCSNCNHSRGAHASPLASLSNVGPCKVCDCGEYTSSGRILRPYMFPFVFMLVFFVWLTISSISWFVNPSIPTVQLQAPNPEYFALLGVLIGTAVFAKKMLKKELLQ